MQEKFLKRKTNQLVGEIHIGGSKSESNRLLILNSLYNNCLKIKNISDSEDTKLLQRALKSQEKEIDIHHAGTAMRFLTAYFSVQPGREVILTGSERMKQRPIGILVDALNALGADISYLEEQGFPPLSIKGKVLQKEFIELDAHISSQYITALMLIAPKLKNGLTLRLNEKITSLPYIMMTCLLMKKFGISIEQEDNTFKIFPKEKIENQTINIESDWSSTSYFYSLAALSENAEIKINSFNNNSLQGDAVVKDIYRTYFGIETIFNQGQITLKKIEGFKPSNFQLNLNANPDLAQTIAVTSAGLRIHCKLTGLETLSIKETDRLAALHNELQKIGAKTDITKDSLEITEFEEFSELPFIETYNDHRMAMSFAPLSLLMDLKIENPDVVIKSYPGFWSDLEKLLKT